MPIKPLAPSIGALFVLTMIFWAPALFHHMTIFHGDFLIDGLPQFDLEARWAQGRAQLLWTNGIYGGHPLFAEGQGAFAHPADLFVAWVVAPLLGVVGGANLFLWWTMFFGGIGVAGLCRSLGASPWAACFAALAVSFSGLWIAQLQNPAIAGTLAWIPWCFWAAEAWLMRPGLRSAALLGVAAALAVLAGYPQLYYAALLYLLVNLAIGLLQPTLRRDWLRDWRQRLASGVLALLICVGLSAVQWLPLFELAGLSHRRGGVQLFAATLEGYLRGFLFTDFEHADLPCFHGVGSVLVSLTASLILVIPAPPRLRGHLAASLVLILLGTQGMAFWFLYQHDLVPGLHFFRVTFPDLAVAIIGIGVVAGFVVDGITQRLEARAGLGRAALLALCVLLGSWVWAIAAFGDGHIPGIEYGAVLLVALAGAVLFRYRRTALLPPLMALVLAAECLLLRSHVFSFAPPDFWTIPESVAAIETRPDWRDFKTYDATRRPMFALWPPHAPGVLRHAENFLNALGTLPVIAWDVPGFGGQLALPLQRRMAIQPVIEDEIAGRSATPPGLRLIDILGIRFVALDQPVETAQFHTIWHGRDDGAWILENDAARPRFQIYGRPVDVETPEQALDVLRRATAPVLVVEKPGAAPSPAAAAADAPPAADIQVVEASATSYRLRVSAQAPAWLFLADANYPGWHAALDGVDTPILTAQILGKAVAIPAGAHDLTLRFDPASFRYGLAISLLTLAGLAAALIAGTIRTRGRCTEGWIASLRSQ